MQCGDTVTSRSRARLLTLPFVLVCVCLLCVMSAQVDGDLWRTAKFIDSVKIPYIAPSLGGVESLIEQPTVISYWDQVWGCVVLVAVVAGCTW